jgi:hypothetical protein
MTHRRLRCECISSLRTRRDRRLLLLLVVVVVVPGWRGGMEREIVGGWCAPQKEQSKTHTPQHAPRHTAAHALLLVAVAVVVVAVGGTMKRE